ncbi:MAG: hypothetical protein HGA90_04210, partial [Alphaproteobacteria bacterium]|nr:hypothetical protein [Alphaproteobacteria bacterium]
VLLKPDGATVVAGIGEEITYADGKIAKVTNVMPKQTEIFVEGKKKTLPLEAASEITSKATSARSKEMSTDTGKDAKSGGASSSSSKGNKGKL